MATVIGKTDVYWHVYRPDQIRSRHRGKLIYVLEIPTVSGPPIMRSIFDLTGKLYPANLSARLAALFVDRRDHGIVFAGVNKTTIDHLITLDPEITADDPLFFNYNWALIRNATDNLLSTRDADPPTVISHFAAARNAFPAHSVAPKKRIIF